MPRELTTDMEEILLAYKRRDTLDLYRSKSDPLRLSRGHVVRTIEDDPVTYDNWIRSVSEMRSSIDQSVDRVTVTCQNLTSDLGFDLASDLRQLDYAIVEYGKQYESLRTPGLLEDISQLFRGVLANAEAGEEEIIFEVIVDYESLGSIIASRGLSPLCTWVYQNGIECTSASIEALCPRTRKACIARGVEQEFGGWADYEQPASTPPGEGGNDGGGIGSGECFTLNTPIWTPAGEIPIGDLPLGRLDYRFKVVSFDETTGEIDMNDEILEVLEHDASSGYFTIEFEHGIVNVTPEHRFFKGSGEFEIADRLRIGGSTKVFSDAWLDSKIKRIRWNSDAKVKVRNLHVKRNHTYFANRCGVHNAKPLNPYN